ncbi:MAG: hypothetical protein C0598_01135 [Marinilabiliales bacterium]|nr:MAG: hypothetical protein C0598_01135 [Marinilabiliales bacterium]
MKRNILLVVLALLIGFGTYAQEGKTKQQKKQEKKEKALQEWNDLKKFIEKKDYVFTGSLFDGQAVDPKINFIYVKDKHATIQFANGFGGGPNGIGGITVDGEITAYSMMAKKEGKAIVVQFTVNPKLGQGVRGPINVNLRIYSYESAHAGLNGSTGLMEGEIREKAKSKIFTGNKLN